MKKLTLHVTGMHCQSCEVLLTDEISELPGVTSVNVSQKKGTVDVSFDEKKVTLEKIKAIISNEGYTAQ